MREGVFVPDLTRSGVRVRGLGLVWTSGPPRSDRDQHQTRSRTRHRNLTRLVSFVLLTSLVIRVEVSQNVVQARTTGWMISTRPGKRRDFGLQPRTSNLSRRTCFELSE